MGVLASEKSTGSWSWKLNGANGVGCCGLVGWYIPLVMLAYWVCWGLLAGW